MNNQDQIALWNGPYGQKWADNSAFFDELFAPLNLEIMGRANIAPGEHVLEIGCGSGAMTILASDIVGETGSALGIDPSGPLIKVAKANAEAAGSAAQFVAADAHAYELPRSMDKAVSRLGASYFSHPAEAFAGLHKKMVTGGKLVSVSWQSLLKNPWARLTFETSIPFLREIPPLPPIGFPGPFAFAGRDWLGEILEETGWKNIEIEGWKQSLPLPGNTHREGAKFLLELGPTGSLLAKQGADLAKPLAALEAHLSELPSENGRTYIGASAWIVSATAG